MSVDFCTISTEAWVAISIGAALWGLFAGYALEALFSQSELGLSASAMQPLAGGCLLLIAIGAFSGFGVAKLIPDDPCGGAFSSLAGIVPLFVALLVSVGAVALFWVRAWRR